MLADPRLLRVTRKEVQITTKGQLIGMMETMRVWFNSFFVVISLVQKVGTRCGQAIVQGRQAKGITQKDLAFQIQEKIQVVQEYESGRAVPNQKVLTKFERALGVQLKGLVERRQRAGGDDD